MFIPLRIGIYNGVFSNLSFNAYDNVNNHHYQRCIFCLVRIIFHKCLNYLGCNYCCNLKSILHHQRFMLVIIEISFYHQEYHEDLLKLGDFNKENLSLHSHCFDNQFIIINSWLTRVILFDVII